MSAPFTLQMTENSNNTLHLFAYVTDKNVMSSVPTKEMKDLNNNLYFLKMKKSFVVLPLIHRK